MDSNEKRETMFRFDGKDIDINRIEESVVEDAKQEIEQCEQALAAARVKNDHLEIGTQLIKLGEVYEYKLAQVHQALECFAQALNSFEELGEQTEKAKCHLNLGEAYILLKDFSNALDHYKQAFLISADSGDYDIEVKALLTLAMFHFVGNKPKEAIEMYQQALDISREIGNKDLEATALQGLGAVLQMEKVGPAILCYEQALAIFRAKGNQEQEANVLLSLGSIFKSLGKFEMAFSYMIKALTLSRSLGDRSQEAMILKNIALVYYKNKQLDQAIETLQDSVKIYDEVGDPGVDDAREKLSVLLRIAAKKWWQFWL